MSPNRTTLRRAATVAALAVAGVLTAVGAASAHVTVHPESYAKGATCGAHHTPALELDPLRGRLLIRYGST